MSAGLWIAIADQVSTTWSINFSGVSDAISTQLDSVSAWIASIKKTVEPILWLLGSFLALVPGSIAIYKWIYYRYSRLPERLDDMLELEERRLKDARAHLLRIIERPRPHKDFKTPIFVVPALGRALRQMKWAKWKSGRNLNPAINSLDSALDDLDRQLKYWDGKHANFLRQQATAYLLKGAIAAANGANRKKVNGKDGLEHNREALVCFLKALDIDASDHEALEYAAHQQRILGMVDEAYESYKALEAMTAKPGPEFAIIRVRALRYMGEMLEKKFDMSNIQLRLTEAKAKLSQALSIVPTIARDELDHAFVHRALAGVELKRRPNPSLSFAEGQCVSAERIFLELVRRRKDTEEAEAGLAEVRQIKDAISKLRNASADEVPSGSPPN